MEPEGLLLWSQETATIHSFQLSYAHAFLWRYLNINFEVYWQKYIHIYIYIYINPEFVSYTAFSNVLYIKHHINTERILNMQQNRWPRCSYLFTRFFARGLLIALMMEAVSTFETSINSYETTRRNIPEDSHLHLKVIDHNRLSGFKLYSLTNQSESKSLA
jgi:hypothetical protein